MINKNSEEYKQGLKDGIKITTQRLLDVAHSFRRDMMELMELEIGKQ